MPRYGDYMVRQGNLLKHENHIENEEEENG